MIPVISVPILNRYDLLDKSLEAIDFEVKEILVINNGIENYVPKRKDLNIRVLNLPSNLGMSGSWNLTIKLYPHEKFWIFSSADTIWEPGGLKKLFDASGESRLVTTHRGFCVFSLGENVVRKIGLFDESYYPYLFEDSDYSDRVRLSIIDGNKNNLELVDISNVFDKSIGDGTTVASDLKLKRKIGDIHKKNQDYYNLKKSQDFKMIGDWNIDIRRSQEWLS